MGMAACADKCTPPSSCAATQQGKAEQELGSPAEVSRGQHLKRQMVGTDEGRAHSFTTGDTLKPTSPSEVIRRCM